MAPHDMTNGHSCLPSYTWDELKKHSGKDSKWIAVDGHVYDVTSFIKRHPGGARIMSHFAGHDASEVWHAMHIDKDKVIKYLKPLLIGKIEENDKDDPSEGPINEDFRKLRRKVEEMNLFRVNPLFFLAHLGHIIALEVIAFTFMWYYGTGWIPFILTACILATSQAQAGWSQHDYGHLSVFRKSWMNHLAHHFVIGHLKGTSSHWWNFRHHQHHAKPNILSKDPDVSVAYVFLLGNQLPKLWGKAKRGFMPYNWQQDYFWIIGPPILLPVYFHLEVIYFVIKRRDWVDLAWMLTFFARFFYMYTYFMGGWAVFGLYMLTRFIESHWFTFVTQMNHIPMEIDSDKHRDWVSSQLISSCNVEPSFFNDWFTGHLNFQIEHHLFPTMPRHNYIKVQPMVKELCAKHGLKYIEKPLFTAMADIVRSLRTSGELWYEAYHLA